MTDDEIVATLAYVLDDTATGIYMRRNGEGWGRNMARILLPAVRDLLERDRQESITEGYRAPGDDQ